MPSRSYNQPDGLTTVDVIYTPHYGAAPPDDFQVESTIKIVNGAYRWGSTPNYHARVNAGEHLPHKSYRRFDYKENRPHGTYNGTYASGSKGYGYSQNPCRPVNGSTSSEEAARQLLDVLSLSVNETALLQAALGQCQPDLDAGTFLAEAHKTVELLIGARRRTIALVRKGLSGGITKASQALGSAWLEWRYGWRILGYDIEAAVQAYNYPFRDNIVTGRAGTSLQEVDSYTDPDSNYYVNFDKVSERSRDLSVRANASVAYSGKTINALLSPVTTGWELIPFSFVADWFVSAGDALKAWQVVSSALSVYCSIGYKLTETVITSVQNPTLGTGTWASSPYSATGTSTSNMTLRTRVPRGPPSLLPQIRVSLNSKRILDAAALLATRFKSTGGRL
jgi:hypothetical protein